MENSSPRSNLSVVYLAETTSQPHEEIPPNLTLLLHSENVSPVAAATWIEHAEISHPIAQNVQPRLCMRKMETIKDDLLSVPAFFVFF